MLDLEKCACPVCQHVGSQLLHQTTYPEQGYPGPFALRRCNTCGLLFNSPRLDDAELGHLYGRNYYFFQRSDARELGRIVGMYRRTVALIESLVASKRSIDIGCGRGYFPAVLKRLGWNADGIEISPDAAEYARQRFLLDVFTGTVEQFAGASQAKQFPLVTAIDVIEHVPEPDAFVAAAARLVEAGGYLIIDTPNAASSNIASKGVCWKGFNPFHIYLFTIDNLAALLARHGMSIERSFSYGNDAQPLDLRDRVASGLKMIGLARPAARAFFAIKGLSIRRGDPESLLDRAAERIAAGGSYLQSPDATAALALGKTGDNIVVIARKDV